ncbi:MAG: ornithine carbamoyltransferase [Myxococcales bacterium]|nr:ornithine carbamoyltransferase [Myxococcales bacterium]
MPYKHLTGLDQINAEEMTQLLELSAKIKADPDAYRTRLAGKSLAMIFQKPSTRTRVSFQVGIYQLGGQALVMGQNDLQLGRGETLADTARVMSRYVHGIMARVFAHSDVVELATHATVPVINGLSDLLHPCQAICDYLTMKEHLGDLSGLRVAYLGDGNNVAHSLAYGAARLGVSLVIGTPGGRYAPDEAVIARAREDAKATGASIDVVEDPREAVAGARVVYTDVWTSMGQEAENERRLADLHAFQLTGELFAQADKDAIFMHCLPAHRGEEVTDEVADHERSVIFDQAENRLHTQKALLVTLMG